MDPISAIAGALAGVAFPSAIAWRLLRFMEKRITVAENVSDKRMAAMESSLRQIVFLLADQARPETRAACHEMENGDGLEARK